MPYEKLIPYKNFIEEKVSYAKKKKKKKKKKTYECHTKN